MTFFLGGRDDKIQNVLRVIQPDKSGVLFPTPLLGCWVGVAVGVVSELWVGVIVLARHNR